MPIPIDVSPVPASPARLPGSTQPLPEVDAIAQAPTGQEINDRRASVENAEVLRWVRAL